MNYRITIALTTFLAASATATWFSMFYPEVNVIFNGVVIPSIVIWLFMVSLRVKQTDTAFREALNEAGKAITETLKVSFDNLKKVSGNVSKTSSKVSEHERRLHWLEQLASKASADARNKIQVKKDAAESSRPTPSENGRRKYDERRN